MVDGQFLVSNIQMKVCRITKSHSQSSNNHTRAPARFQQQSDDTVMTDCVGGSPDAGDDISTEEVGRDRDDHPDQMWDHELPARTNPQGC